MIHAEQDTRSRPFLLLQKWPFPQSESCPRSKISLAEKKDYCTGHLKSLLILSDSSSQSSKHSLIPGLEYTAIVTTSYSAVGNTIFFFETFRSALHEGQNPSTDTINRTAWLITFWRMMRRNCPCNVKTFSSMKIVLTLKHDPILPLRTWALSDALGQFDERHNICVSLKELSE